MKKALARRVIWFWLPLLLGWLTPQVASAHATDSASLVLSESSPGRFELRFHVGSSSRAAELTAPAVFPKQCTLQGDVLDCGSRGLTGRIEFPWLEGTLTRVIVDVRWLSGARLLRVVAPSAPRLDVYGIPSSAGVGELWPLVSDHVRLGIEHILTGFDHLSFVIALALLVRGRRALIATITAFTLAHSASLAAMVLELWRPPVAPVEACIALSIVLVCAECLRPEGSLTGRVPWLLAFAFGVLHGLGFASALLAIGLPPGHVPLALLCFNVGVELGQLGVVVAVLAIVAWSRQLPRRPRWLGRSLIYAMGSGAACWFLQRLPAVFRG